MKPIYKPSGKAAEYGDYAINIYTGCPHRCFYCFAPNVLHQNRQQFHEDVRPRDGIVEAAKRQMEKENITDRLIHMCFTCDPYPTGYDSRTTREIIKVLKEAGNHVQILTKGDGSRDFDLLDENDWYGITYDGVFGGKFYDPRDALYDVAHAKRIGIKTWCSFEPVIHADRVLDCIKNYHDLFDKVKIGKLNYYPSDVDWKKFESKAESLCKRFGIDYYIKESLREEMYRLEE